MRIGDRPPSGPGIVLSACLVAALGCGHAGGSRPADRPAETETPTVNNAPAPRLDPAWLQAHGFREQDGQFVRRAVALKELAALLGFSPETLEAEPGMPPDAQRATVMVNGGICTVDYHEPERDLDDPQAVVDARVELFLTGAP